jgi:hypothetical protein
MSDENAEDTESIEDTESDQQAEREQEQELQLSPEVIAMTGVLKLNKDLAASVKLMSPREVRYLVDTYYSFQKVRIRAGNQEKALTKSEEPHEVLKWLRMNGQYLESQIAAALAVYAQEQRLCRWVMSIKGLKHILACGLYANLDLNRAFTASHIWRFCGLDPSSVWLGSEKGEKLVNKHIANRLEGMPLIAAVALELHRKAEYVERDCIHNAKFNKRKTWNHEDLRKVAALCPYNRTMKVICWKIGSSFNMLRNKDDCFYGKMLAIRHSEMDALNASGGMKEKADAALAAGRYKKVKVIKVLKEGRMPDGWVFGTAKRIVVKTFLFHYYQRGRELMGLPWVKPYSIVHQGHADFMDAPPMVE